MWTRRVVVLATLMGLLTIALGALHSCRSASLSFTGSDLKKYSKPHASHAGGSQVAPYDSGIIAPNGEVSSEADSRSTDGSPYPRFTVERSTVASSAVDVGQSILERYERTNRWGLVFSEVLDLSGSAWGAILRTNDGARVSVVLALPEVLGRRTGTGDPTVVTELIVDVVQEKRLMHE